LYCGILEVGTATSMLHDTGMAFWLPEAEGALATLGAASP
jgi:hypothetical protein